MKIAGRGRIVIWEGASLWIMEALPASGATSNSTDFHSHHAIQITLSLGGRIELSSRDRSIKSHAAVAPDISHFLEGDGLIAVLFIEPESQQGRAITKSLFAQDDLTPVPEQLIGDLVLQLQQAYRDPKVDEALLEKLGRLLVIRLAGLSQAESPDARIQKIMTYAAARLEESISLSAAAKNAGLSPSRARHLFVEQIGLPFRKYLLWLRIMRAVAIFAEGHSLTQAAHEAGFADSAHFSRTFRRMYGIPAASLQIL